MNSRYGLTPTAEPHRQLVPPARGPLAAAVAALLVAASSGCTWFGYGDAYRSAHAERPYTVVGSKRYVSGPYGNIGEIEATIDMVKRQGEARTVASRAVALPSDRSFVRVFDYRFPEHCGGYRFRVFESPGVQVLEYRHESRGVTIRDYVAGPSPFIEAGLWTPYDHTAEHVRDMTILSGKGDEDGMGLLEGTYEIGPVTSLAKPTLLELGNQYNVAVHAASGCVRQAAAYNTP